MTVALELNRLYPNDPEILYHTGRIYGNYAFLTFHKLEVVAPTSIWRHQAAAEAYESEGSTDSAIREYHVVLQLDPRRANIHYRIGRTLLARWQLTRNPEAQTQAAQEFEQELQLDPGNANASYELAEIHRQRNELDQARELFETALKYYPDFQEAQVGLATVLIAQQKARSRLAAFADGLSHSIPMMRLRGIAWDWQIEPSARRRSRTRLLPSSSVCTARLALQQGTSTPEEVTKQVLQNGEVQ